MASSLVVSEAFNQGFTMPSEIGADLFWVLPLQNPEGMIPAIRAFVACNTDSEATFGSTRYLLNGASWSAQGGILTGTIFKRRHFNLPSKLSGARVSRLDLGDDDDLGEPMCFAYCPEISAAAVHFSFNGPRHGRLANFLNHIGFEPPIEMSPILRRDALERLQRARIIRKAAFTLRAPQHLAELRAIGNSVGCAISSMVDMGGVTVEITVGMSYESGTLNLDRVKRAFQRLSNFGDTVTKLEVLASPDMDESPVPIDLINDRITERISVNYDGRELDKGHCCAGLRGFLNDNRPEIVRQFGQRQRNQGQRQ